MGEDSKIILNGKLIPETEGNILVTSRGLLYGDGCFETFRAYQGRFLGIRSHLKRLSEGLNYLSIEYPEGLRENFLNVQLRSLLETNNLIDKDVIIRIQVWRKGTRGYKVETNLAGYSITATPIQKEPAAYKLATVDVKRVPSAAVPARFKLSNGINYIKAAGQAVQQDADDALLETVEHFVSETTIANIFWLKKQSVFTPSLDCDILPGVTRAICLNLLRNHLNKEVIEGAFTINDIKEAEAVWICNSIKEIQPISCIDETVFNVHHDFIQLLIKEFKAYRERKLLKLKSDKKNR